MAVSFYHPFKHENDKTFSKSEAIEKNVQQGKLFALCGLIQFSLIGLSITEKPKNTMNINQASASRM